jgi:hypothetical protein
MKVLSKKEYNNRIIEGLFSKGGTLACKKEKFCTGKYNETIIGSEVVNLEGVSIVWAESRKDKEGKYYTLFCA